MPAWLGGPEFVLIMLVVVVLFGWKKLPDAARSLGRSMRIFKAEVQEMKKDGESPASKETVSGQTVPPPATDAAPPQGKAEPPSPGR